MQKEGLCGKRQAWWLQTHILICPKAFVDPFKREAETVGAVGRRSRWRSLDNGRPIGWLSLGRALHCVIACRLGVFFLFYTWGRTLRLRDLFRPYAYEASQDAPLSLAGVFVGEIL